MVSSTISEVKEMCIIRKNTIVKTYGDYLKYAIPDEEMIASISHQPQEKYKLPLEHDDQSVKMHMTEYK